MPLSTDRRLLLLSTQDDCLIVCEALPANTEICIEGRTVRLTQAIAIGHKLARHDLAPGQVVHRYGAPIGSMKRAARCGEHLHTHNLKSDYIPTYTLQPDQQFVNQHAA